MCLAPFVKPVLMWERSLWFTFPGSRLEYLNSDILTNAFCLARLEVHGALQASYYEPTLLDRYGIATLVSERESSRPDAHPCLKGVFKEPVFGFVVRAAANGS